MRFRFLLIILLVNYQVLFSQNITGSWYGSIRLQGTEIPLVFHIKQTGDSLSSVMDSPAQGAKNIAVAKTLFQHNELSLQLPQIMANYKGKLLGDSIDGIFTQGGIEFPLMLKQTENKTSHKRPQEPKPPYNYHAEEVIIQNHTDSVTLAGTLTTPGNKKNFPVVILISGSGTTNRDGEMMEHKPFLVIADDFARKGIGVLRLDDRGAGKSTLGRNWQSITSENFAGDINEAVDFLHNQGFQNIGLAGHSEGGIIAPMVVAKNKHVKFMILMAAPAADMLEVLKTQNARIAAASGLSDSLVQNAIAMNTLLNYTILYGGNSRETRDKYFEALRQKLNFTMPDQQKSFLRDEIEKMAASEWYKYFIAYKPKAKLQQITIPVLAINGSKDVQVDAQQNLPVIEAALKKAGNKNYKVMELPGLNHLFQTAGTGLPMEYSAIEETFSPAALDVMSSWILSLPKRK